MTEEDNNINNTDSLDQNAFGLKPNQESISQNDVVLDQVNTSQNIVDNMSNENDIAMEDLVMDGEKMAKQEQKEEEDPQSLRESSEVEDIETPKEIKDKYKISKDFAADSALLQYIPEDSARFYKIVPIEFDSEGTLVVGSTNPKSVDAKDALNFIASKNNIQYNLVKISDIELNSVLKQYNEASEGVQSALSEYEKSDDAAFLTSINQSSGGQDGSGEVLFSSDLSSKGESSKIIQEDAPILKLVNSILIRAVDLKASDVHVEPMEGQLMIRYRVDGDMTQGFKLPANIHTAIVSQLKIRARIRLDEKRIPQDGRFGATIRAKKIDFRVATVPTPNGEKMVLRLLDNQQGIMDYDTLGLSDDVIDIITKGVSRPYGMILSSGPTGSGKTTTIYSILTHLDREKKNILSLENPVEISINGIYQSEIRPEIGYTFAKGLRHFLRADPDIIFVGEIRDQETAALAVQASLTGHLVLSTIHTNTAAGVIPRLIDMGVDPYLIAPSLSVVIGQRLVRTFCGDENKKQIDITSEKRNEIENQFSTLSEEKRKSLPDFNKFYEAVPTKACPTGMKGRVAVAEGYIVDKDIEKIIFQNPSELLMSEELRKKGMLTMGDDAVIKASKGVIPFSEVSSISTDSVFSGDQDDTEKPVSKKRIIERKESSIEKKEKGEEEVKDVVAKKESKKKDESKGRRGRRGKGVPKMSKDNMEEKEKVEEIKKVKVKKAIKKEDIGDKVENDLLKNMEKMSDMDALNELKSIAG